MTLILVLNLIGLLFIVVGVFLQLPIKKWLEKKFGDNPNKARVYIDLFNKYFPVDGKYIKTRQTTSVENDGEKFKTQLIRLYEYTWQGRKRTVGVPDGYPLKFINGRLSIHVKAGEAIACLPGKDVNFNFNVDEYDTVVRSGLAVDLINSVTGKKTPSWILIIIIVVIAVGAYFLYQNFYGSETPAAGPGGPGGTGSSANITPIQERPVVIP